MTRLVPTLALLALLGLCLGGLPSDADESAEGIAWFPTLKAARAAAQATGRPIWIALHPLRVEADAGWPYDGAEWARVYADPAVVNNSRRFVCFRRRIPEAPAGGPSPHDGRPVVGNRFEAPTFLVFDATGRQLLARQEGWTHATGEASVRALGSWLDRAWGRLDTQPVGAIIGPAAVPVAAPAPSGSRDEPLGVGLDSPGIKLQLRWSLPLPEATGDKPLRAQVSMHWDGVGPFLLDVVDLPSGKDADIPVVVRYADHAGLPELITKGRHRLDIYMAPVAGGFQFSEAPLHIGVVWIDAGNSGGGGGGAGDQPQPEEQPEQPDPNQPEPQPDEPGTQPEVEPPPPGDEHVVEPFIRDGDEVEKDDAIVGVEADDAGVKPPPLEPAAPLPRDFQKVLEQSVNWERIPLAERAFLREYFAAMQAALKRLEERRAKGSGK